MKSTTKKFMKEQMTKELDYVWAKYLGKSIKIASEFVHDEESNRNICTAIICGKEYKLYQDVTGGLILIPVKITDFTDDFDDIIMYEQVNHFFRICLLQRKNGVVEIKEHTFSEMKTKEETVPSIDCSFKRYDDENNDLQLALATEGGTLPMFIARKAYHLRNKPSKTFIVRMTRNQEETRKSTKSIDLETNIIDIALDGMLDEIYKSSTIETDNVNPMILLAEGYYQKEQEKAAVKANKK